MDFRSLFTSIAGALRLLAASLKKSDSVHGIKETAELLRAMLRLASYLVLKFKDGVQWSDVTDFLEKMKTDEEFKKVFADALDKADQMPAEIKDIDVGEGIELGAIAVEEVPYFIEAAQAAPALPEGEGDAANASS